MSETCVTTTTEKSEVDNNLISSNEEKKPLSEIYKKYMNNLDKMKMYVMCDDLHPLYKNYCIETTEKMLVDMVETILNTSIEENKKNFRDIYHFIVSFDENQLQTFCNENNKEWIELSYHILIFYCLRKVIFPNKNIKVGYLPAEENKIDSEVITNS